MLATSNWPNWQNMEDKENRYRYGVDLDDRDIDTPDGQLKGESDAMKHRRAYAEMTKNAVPLPRNSSEPIRTPSRKRRRVHEIAESDTSSAADAASPSKSTPRRPLERLSPTSEPRRASAPTRLLNSPSLEKSDFWKAAYSPEDWGEVLNCKEENLISSPPWVLKLLESIRPAYPDSSFGAEGVQVKCFDCDGKLYKLQHQSAVNFKRHLDSKTHQNNVEAKRSVADTAVPVTYMPTKSVDFSMPPPDPITIFAQRNQVSVYDAGMQYLQALKNESNQKEIRMSRAEYVVHSTDKRVDAKLDEFKNSYEMIKESHEEKIREFTESFEAEQEAHDAKIQDLEGRLDEHDGRTREKFTNIKESITTINVTNEHMDKTTGELKRGFSDLKRSTTTFVDRIEDKVANLTGKLESSTRDTGSRLEDLENKVRYNVVDRLDGLSGKIKTLEKSKLKIKGLQDANDKHKESIYDLESQLQMQKDEFQRHQQNEDTLRQEILDRMALNFQQHNTRFALLQTESETRIKALEESTSSRISLLEAATEEKLQIAAAENKKRMKELEENHEETRERCDAYDSIFDVLFQDSKELREFVEGMANEIGGGDVNEDGYGGKVLKSMEVDRSRSKSKSNSNSRRTSILRGRGVRYVSRRSSGGSFR